MWTVNGAVYGRSYTVTWGDDGLLTGDADVIALLHDTAGQQVAVPPVGPVYDLNLTDEKSVLAALLDLTTVQEVAGAPPQVVPDSDPAEVN